MFETMAEYAGIGLAAPQVHQSLRLFVAGLRDAEIPTPLGDDADMPYLAIVNPEITPLDEATATGWEGCLSIPDIRGQVTRPRRVQVRGLDRRGRKIELVAEGLPARVIQHETDHLDGVLFFDRMASLGTLTYMDEFQRYWAKDDDE
jgi:peptide deformylase